MGFLISEGTSSPGIRRCDPQFREEEERRPPAWSDGQEGGGGGLGPSWCPGFPAEVSRTAGVCRLGVSAPEERVHADRQFQPRVRAAPSPPRPRRRQQQPWSDFPSPPPALSLLLRPGRSPAPDPGGDGVDGRAQGTVLEPRKGASWRRRFRKVVRSPARAAAGAGAAVKRTPGDAARLAHTATGARDSTSWEDAVTAGAAHWAR
ncbi:PREDICTED: uncharacterized protein LOC105591033 isoform X1 [Cercocebus atys]|uniref:uncharacterized protein LOC105591033 isoform X1 n=1 Tax=Cercocebus atys TaxID=9531 RepID=UPI0005F53B28|nr:PREDICTED: uncharacterized protein LOC105591033 isoform X1 [Cercocebus atys]